MTDRQGAIVPGLSPWGRRTVTRGQLHDAAWIKPISTIAVELELPAYEARSLYTRYQIPIRQGIGSRLPPGRRLLRSKRSPVA
jgi:hypothetical protein